MAKKKIGALIVLDGEKEFKQSVTNCNKSLTTLKSEMSLVKAESEGQANSLEALQKKHDVLSRVLEEQEKKQEAVVAGLDHAREEYEKVGSGIESLNRQQEAHVKKIGELNEAYGAAEKRLGAMEKAGGSSEQAMKKQEAVVQSLAAELKQEETALSDVSSEIARGEKNYQSASNHIKDWETKLNTAKSQTIKANSELNKNAAYMKEAEDATDHCATSIDGFGKEVKKAEEVTIDFGTVVKTNLGNTLVEAIKGMVSDAVKSVGRLESAQQQLQASTGLTTTEMGRYKTVMNDLHTNNYGEDVDDVAKSMALVKQYTGEIDPTKLGKVTENGIAMRDVFDMDLSETIRGVDSLVENMGITSEEAFDLMARGAQNGLNRSGELADNIAEYGQLWGQAGFSAKEMFGILQNGLDSGAYNLDKVNDFVKEFGNSLADGRVEKNLGHFSDKTKDLFYQWKAGKATTKDVFHSVINDLSTATDKQEMLTLASDTWSALGEDNAMKVITSLAKVNTGYDDVKGTMEEIKEIKYDTVASRFEQLGKKFQTEVGVPIAEKALPLIEDGLDAIIGNMDTLLPLVVGVGTSFAAYTTATKAVSLLEGAISGTAFAQDGLNFAAKTNPYILLGTVALGAVTAYETLKDRLGETSEELDRVAESNKKVCDSAKNAAEEASNVVSSYAESSADLEAQSEYAKTLAERIETLAEKTGLSNSETELMQGYIAELNQIVPELNLSYDEQAGELNQASDAIDKYIDSSMREIEANAAKEYAIELIKKRTELEIEKKKLETESGELTKQLTEVNRSEADSIKETAEARIHLGYQNLDNQKSYKELTQSQKENKEASDGVNASLKEVEAEYAATSETLEGYGISIADVTQKTDENAQAASDNATAQQEAADANAEAAQSIAETYTGAQQTLSELLDTQMDMFESFSGTVFDTQEDLDKMTQTVLDNMQSQVDGVTFWADNVAALTEKGVDQGILQKLAEMGPEGVQYVQAFANMSGDELKHANELWTKSMDMKSGVSENVQGMLESYTVALNGGKDKVNETMKAIGYNSVQGLVKGVNENLQQTAGAGKAMGDTLTGATREALESHSPSLKMYAVGQDASVGLSNGILSKYASVRNGSKMVAESAVEEAKSALPSSTFYNFGQSVTEGLAQGILSGRSSVVNAVSSMCASAVSQAKRDLDINSPSKVFASLGEYSAEGYGEGFGKQMASVQGAIADSMRFAEPPRGQDTAGAYLDGNLENTIENALYNGMVYAMSRAKADKGDGSIQVSVNIGKRDITEVLVEADREHKARTGGIGLLEG